MKTTEPLVLFSKGTTPRCTLPSCTAAKTSSMVVCGARIYWSDENVSRVALVVRQRVSKEEKRVLTVISELRQVQGYWINDAQHAQMSIRALQ